MDANVKDKPNSLVNMEIQKKKVFEVVYDKLRELIVSGEFGPGEKIPNERDLASSFKVSRNTVRTALKLLEFTGLIEIKHGIGIIVSENINTVPELIDEYQMLQSSSKNPLMDIIEVRRSFSIYVVQLATERATENDLRKLSDALARMEVEVHKKDYVMDHINAFYIHLYYATKNIFMYRIGVFFQQMLQESRIISFKVEKNAPQVLQIHKQLLEAIKSRDAKAACDIMNHYLDVLIELHS